MIEHKYNGNHQGQNFKWGRKSRDFHQPQLVV